MRTFAASLKSWNARCSDAVEPRARRRHALRPRPHPEAAPQTNDLLGVRVLSVRYEAEDINSYELVDPDGR